MGGQRTTAVYVGIFVIVGVVILMWFSVRTEGIIAGDRHTLHAEFDDVLGLSRGNPVTFRGVEIGKIGPMDVNPETGRPRVTLWIQREWPLRENAQARLVLPSMLGQRAIDIFYPEEGPAGAALADGDVITTQRTHDMAQALTQIGDVAGEIRHLITSVDENQERAFGAFTSLIEDNRARIDELIVKVDSTTDTVSEVASRITEGEGTLSRLVNDPALADDITVGAANFREVSERMALADGTLWRLIEDDALHGDLETTTTSIRDIAEGLQGVFGEEGGAFAAFGDLADEIQTLTPELSETLASLREITRKINEGEGTIGLLVNDPEVYHELRASLRRLGETFEEAEETGAVRTFLAVIFGAFI